MTMAAGLTQRVVDEADAWHGALAALPAPQPLQSWPWGAQKARWGWSMTPLLWEDRAGAPRAAALILRRPLRGTPFSLLYVPRGPLLDWADTGLRRRVLDDLQVVARRQRAIALKIDPFLAQATGVEPVEAPVGRAVAADLEARGWRFSAEQIQFRNTVTLDLSLAEDDLLASFHQKTRYNIRYAARKGVVVREATAADWPTLLAMYRTTADRNEFTVRPDAYYLDYWRAFADAGMGQGFLAEVDGEPVAGVMILRCHDVAIYKDGASTGQARRLMPNYLLQWEAIRWAKTQGCCLYDFWGAPDLFDPADNMWGVWRFKSGFNGEVVRTIGAWDFPTFGPLYRAYTSVLPRYVAWLRRRGAPAN